MIELLTIADLITLTNATFGFLAMLFIITGSFRLAAIFIFLGLILDGLDGYIARRTRTGKIGEGLESIADMLTLSVAPLLLVYFTYLDKVSGDIAQHLLFAAVLVFSLVCTTIRLSSFSLLKNPAYFQGLPTSASAIFLVVLSILQTDLLIVVPIVVALAIAMLSSIKFIKPNVAMNLVTAALLITVMVLYNMYDSIAPYALLAVLLGYIIIGPIYVAKRQGPYGKAI